MMDPYVIFAFGIILGASLSAVVIYISVRIIITRENNYWDRR